MLPLPMLCQLGCFYILFVEVKQVLYKFILQFISIHVFSRMIMFGQEKGGRSGAMLLGYSFPPQLVTVHIYLFGNL